MALLRHANDDAQQWLASRTLVGRSPACQIRLENPHASGEHATIQWTGTHWELKDLGSRNGTFVDGARVDAGKPIKLSQGSRIAFGDPDAAWEVQDDAPPTTLAINLDTNEIQPEQDGLLVLPNDTAPELTFYQTATGDWVEEGDEDVRVIQDQEIVQAGGQSFRIQLPFISDHTPLLQLEMSLETVHLTFAVSRDEERVQITVTHRGVDTTLDSREHAYVLLTLARARVEDENLPATDRGWRERADLERMLAMDSNALNVAIHRARQQLARAGINGAAGIVEVERKRRRLGIDRFRIVRLD